MGEARAVNFFGHAWLAARRRPDAGFVFGAMLPDLAAMAGLRVERVAPGEAGAGFRFHHQTDAVFHASACFRTLSVEATQRLLHAGVSRGAARAIGHVGVELLLDGWLAAEHGVPGPYREALTTAPTLLRAVAFRQGAGAEPLLAVCGRIAAVPDGADWCAPARLALRLARILARHPRLALVHHELPAVERWAAGASPAVADAAPRWLAELGDVLPPG